MAKKFSIKEIRAVLEDRQTNYKELGKALNEEAKLARAESNSARSILEGQIAGFVAQLLPNLDTHTLSTFDAIARDHNHPQVPGQMRTSMRSANIVAARAQSEIETEHGTQEHLASRTATLAREIEGKSKAQSTLGTTLEGLNYKLGPLTSLNKKLHDMNAVEVTAATLAQYDRPHNWFDRAVRYVSDKAYREARPLLDGYVKREINLSEVLAEQSSQTTLHDAKAIELQTLKAERTRTQQHVDQLAGLKSAQKTEREILNEVRLATTAMLLSDRNMLVAADAVFPNRLDPQAKAMFTRMELFGVLAHNIMVQKVDMEKVSIQLDKPLSDMKKAINTGRSGKRVEFDLAGKTGKLDQHQKMVAQKLEAARDIRSSSHSTTATSNSGDDSTNWLLWYLILSDNNNAHASVAPAFNSGQGGEFGGGGASGSWDINSDNSLHRAELLGITPTNAADFGLRPEQLQLAPHLMQDLGLNSLTDSSSTAGDFNGLGSGPALGDFNDIAKSMDMSSITQSLDMSSLVSDLSSSVSSISVDMGSSFGGGSDFGGGGGCDFGGGGGGGCD